MWQWIAAIFLTLDVMLVTVIIHCDFQRSSIQQNTTYTFFFLG